MGTRFSLHTTLEVPRKGWLVLYVPDSLIGGTRRRVWIRGTLNGKPFAATANPWKDSTHAITVNRQMRRRLGISGPMEVDLEAEVLDEPVLDVELPDDLVSAIHADPAARATFDALPPSHQKEFVFYLDEAKRPSTRAERVRRSVAVLHAGRHLWEDPSKMLADDLREL